MPRPQKQLFEPLEKLLQEMTEKNRAEMRRKNQKRAMNKQIRKYRKYLLQFVDERSMIQLMKNDNVEQVQSVTKRDIGRFGSYYRLTSRTIIRRQTHFGANPSYSSVSTHM